MQSGGPDPCFPSQFLIPSFQSHDPAEQSPCPEGPVHKSLSVHLSSHSYKSCPNLLLATMVSIKNVEINIRSIFNAVLSAKLHEQDA